MRDSNTGVRFPRLSSLGIPVHGGSVKGRELKEGLKRNHLDGKIFSKLFGVQTCSGVGPYARDVEAVLERMLSGKLTGTQLFWD
jgi:hypothetical protein